MPGASVQEQLSDSVTRGALLTLFQKILENMHARTFRYTQPTFKTQLRRVPALTQIMIFTISCCRGSCACIILLELYAHTALCQWAAGDCARSIGTIMRTHPPAAHWHSTLPSHSAGATTPASKWSTPLNTRTTSSSLMFNWRAPATPSGLHSGAASTSE